MYLIWYTCVAINAIYINPWSEHIQDFYDRCLDHVIILESHNTLHVHNGDADALDDGDDVMADDVTTSYAILEACVYSRDDIFVSQLYNLDDIYHIYV